MKIAFYATTVLEQGGGLEKYFMETASGLAQFEGVEVDVITMDERLTSRLNKLLRFYFFKKQNTTLSEIMKESSDVVQKKLGKVNYYKCKDFFELKTRLSQYDVLYSKNELLEAFILKFFVGYNNLSPIIFGCHTPVYYPVTDSPQSKLHNFLYNGFIYRWLASGVKAFHVANDFDKKLLAGIFQGEDVFMIHNPFNFLQFEENLKKSTFDFKFDTSKCNILWIARLTEQKGVSSLIKIIDEINATDLREKIVFNIIGSGQLDNEVAKIKEKWDNVNWFGYVEYCYLPSIYSQNNIFISTSKWESLPFNILEAQASGLPAIAFDIPGPQDIIDNEKSGFLVKSEQEFCERIENIVDGKVDFSGNEIKNSISKAFNPKDIYAQLLSMFQVVVGRD